MVRLWYNEYFIGVSRIKNRQIRKDNVIMYTHHYYNLSYSDKRLEKIKSALKHMNYTKVGHITENGIQKERYIYGYPE